ncbi:MAG TPA: VTT domain-containing protein [Symbiobacteriaceae bacterium]|nr:VTT domain-containing protein [Symbiobacteriaceae bacterium]
MILDMILSGSGLGSMLSGILEGVGIPWPGAVVLTAAGTKFTGVVGAAVLGTLFAVTYTAGSAVQYAFGRCCRQLLERLLTASMRVKLDRAIEKYGQAAVLWTRPLAVGNYISIPAGMMRMNPVKFLVYTFAGIWPWAFGMALAGGAVGQYMAYATEALPLLAVVLVLVAIFSAVRKLWRRSHETEQFGD